MHKTMIQHTSQLTNKRIIVSNGKAEAQPLIKNITDLLVGKTWFIASANSDENKDTDVGLLKFQDVLILQTVTVQNQ